MLANPAAAKGAKSQLTIKVALVCAGGEQGLENYRIKANSKLSVPDSPDIVTSLNLQESPGGDGELELMIPFSEGYQEQQQNTLSLKGEQE